MKRLSVSVSTMHEQSITFDSLSCEDLWVSHLEYSTSLTFHVYQMMPWYSKKATITLPGVVTQEDVVDIRTLVVSSDGTLDTLRLFELEAACALTNDLDESLGIVKDGRSISIMRVVTDINDDDQVGTWLYDHGFACRADYDDAIDYAEFCRRAVADAKDNGVCFVDTDHGCFVILP